MFIHTSITNLEKIGEAPSKFAGLAATIIGIISFIPILYVVHITKKTKNFPYRGLILALISNLLWIYYAAAKDHIIDKQLMFMGVLYFFIYAFILYTKISY
jgi:uncharacterized protein with PQ loop repeat